MPDVFLARQPIYDRDLEVAGYELLFRDDRGNSVLVSNGEAATSQVILNAFTEFGLTDLVGTKPAFINVSREFLLEASPLPLPQGRVVLELLEHASADAELMRALRLLSLDGYVIALDDFEDTPERRPLLDVAQIVKLDVLEFSDGELEEQVRRVRARANVRVLAEKVETYEMLERCKALGFDLFQGFFFCRPTTLTGRGVPTTQLARLRLLSRLQDPDAEVGELDELISSDVGLSYRLLRYINSAFFSLPREIDSVRQALVLLGRRNLRRWATIMALSGIEDRPQELVVTGLVRARMCELLGLAYGERDTDALFSTGLFSIIDALVDAPMEEVLERLPFSASVKQALLAREGDFGPILKCVLAYERGDLDEIRYERLTGVSLRESYLESVAWANQASAPIQAAAAETPA